MNPSHTTALAHLGQYYEESGHPDQAVAVYQRSLQSDWNQPEVHSRIAAASQSAGPGSPMAATAMARGVHPYSVPRQQTAFGPPSRGARMAQMRMAQNQMGMGGNSMDGGQMAAAPNMMSTHYAERDANAWKHASIRRLAIRKLDHERATRPDSSNVIRNRNARQRNPRSAFVRQRMVIRNLDAQCLSVCRSVELNPQYRRRPNPGSCVFGKRGYDTRD